MKIIGFLINKHSDIFKYLIFAVTVAIVIFILPKEPKFKYEYRKGEQWKHENLFAPFNFPIYKTKAHLNKEIEKIKSDSKLYFELQDIDLNTKINSAKIKFDESWNVKYAYNNELINNDKIKKLHKNHISNIIENIYDKGIIGLTKEIDKKNNDYPINVINNKVVQEKFLGDIFTLQTAFEYIKNNIENISDSAGIKNIYFDKEIMINVLTDCIKANIYINKEKTKKVLDSKIQEVSKMQGLVQKGEKIIYNKELITDKKFQILESLRVEYEDISISASKFYLILIGQIIVISILFFLLILFLINFRKDIWLNNTQLQSILLLVLLMVFMGGLSLKYGFLNIYMIPFCLLPIFIRIFYDTRIALFVHIIVMLIIAYIVPNSFEFVFIQIITGIVAVLSIVHVRKRSTLFVSVLSIFLSYSILYFAFSLVFEADFNSININYFAFFGINTLFILVLSYPLIFIFEKTFGLVSDITLLEVSDINNKLLKELAQKAPGTFQHCIQVSNLAESAIFEIGGNALLVRAGAMYHDIGKSDIPMYFVENQITGFNPHDELNYDESARIIISHVENGIEKCKKNQIPDKVIDFIRTHHGTGKTAYFYNNYIKNFPKESVDDSIFTYKGIKPFSKETAVLMMADSIEAASRSLKYYDADSIEKMINSIINKQIEEEQYSNADITFKEISTIKKIFKKKLMNIYHTRIEYPK